MIYYRSIQGVKDARVLADLFRRLRLSLVRDQAGVATVVATPRDCAPVAETQPSKNQLCRVVQSGLIRTKAGAQVFVSTW
jgi:hypothetical protein